LATAPFCAAWRALVAADLGREADALLDLPAVDPVRFELDRALPDEPFLLVALFEPPLEELLLEDFVFCAIDIASLGLLAFLASCAFRAGGEFALPGRPIV
jgi:hypothetical protein